MINVQLGLWGIEGANIGIGMVTAGFYGITGLNALFIANNIAAMNSGYDFLGNTVFQDHTDIYMGAQLLTAFASMNILGAGLAVEAADQSSAGTDSGSAPRGNLTGELDGLTTDERKMVEDLLESGKDVEIIPRSTVQGTKTPDFLVDGVKTELKTLNGTSLNTPVTRIQQGFKQGAEIVIIDGRNTGLTLENAKIVIERALGTYGGKLPGIVEIWTSEGIIRR